jgi:hypothetical protein
VTAGWQDRALELIGDAEELHIAAQRTDGTLRRWTPIWVVRVGEEVCVRTWHRRDSGWFGSVLRSGRARIRVPELEIIVTVEDVGSADASLRTRIDAAYEAKYGRYGAATVQRMRSDEAAATTLRLRPAQG